MRPTVFGTKLISTVLVFPPMIVALCRMMLSDRWEGVFPPVAATVSDGADVSGVTPCRGETTVATRWNTAENDSDSLHFSHVLFSFFFTIMQSPQCHGLQLAKSQGQSETWNFYTWTLSNFIRVDKNKQIKAFYLLTIEQYLTGCKCCIMVKM